MRLNTIISSVVTAIMLAMCAPTAQAAGPKRHFEAIPGPYNHQITTLHQHSDGLLWIGTGSGLNMYDGYQMIPAPTQHPDSATFLNDYIIKICEDSKGRLWIRSQSQYGVYDPKTQTEEGDVVKILADVGMEESYITDFEADKDGSIWLAVAGEGIYKIPGGTGKAQKSEFQPNGDFNVCDIIFNKYGSAVVVDESGTLTWIDPSTLKVIDQARPTHAMSSNLKENYRLSAVDKSNLYWVYSPTVLEIYDVNEGKWITHMLPDNDKHGTIKTIFQDKKGVVWLARDNHGLERIEKKGDALRFVSSDSPGDITHNNTVTCFLEDNTGTIWLGTQKKGLLTHNDCVQKFELEPLPDVNCMQPDSGNWVWVGTDSSGLWRWNTVTGEKHPVADPAEGNAPAAITSLLTTGDNTLYVGSFAYGLRRVRNGRFERIKTGTELDSTFAWSLTPDGAGGIWIATLGAGVFHYDPATGDIRQFADSDNGRQTLFVNTGVRSKDGRVYFGYADGILYYDPADDRMHDMKDLNEAFDTRGWKIAQLYEDSRGLLWAATTYGLKILDRTHGKVTEVKTSQWKNNNVAGIMEDNGGSIWVSEGRMLTNIHVNYTGHTGEIELSQRHYDISDGIMDSDFNQRSFAKTPGGEILVGGLLGANRFVPAEIKYNSVNPKIIFTELHIGNRIIRPGDRYGKHEILAASLYDGGVVNLPHGTKDFTIYFTTDNFAQPGKTRYHYKLEGYDDEWLTLPEGRHNVTYTNLPAGHYRLMVSAFNRDGYESDIPGILQINVAPSFWTTGWAMALYVIAALLIALGAYLLISHIEKRRFRQRLKDEERKKQDEINQLKFQFFTNISHDLRTPLTLIVSPLDEMIKETEDIRQKKRLKLLKDNASRLLTLVNQLLDFRRSEVAGLNFNPTEGDIVAFSRKVCDSFTAMSERKRVNFSFYSDREQIMMSFDKDKLEKILMNLLGNAFKFTPSYGRVDVAIELTGDDEPMLRIKVADSGPGIPDKDKELVFHQFYQSEERKGSQVQIGSGIGLSMVKEYVRLHDGTVRVTDNVEYGSVFIIELPIHHAPTPPPADDTEATAEEHATDKEESSHPDGKEDSISRTHLPTVLVVDDNPDLTEMLKFELENEYDVVTAADGNEALTILEHEKPEIIITDLMMPGMDGIELCRRLKSNPDTVGIPLIILTAKHDLGVKIEGLTIGADDYITKPFNLDILRLRMKRLIGLTAKGATRTLIEPEAEPIKVTPLDEKLIEDAMRYVSHNIDSDRLSVEDLSDHLGMSRVKLYKKIKQITGKTPIEFIRIIRLKRAAQLLRESQLNVSEVAYKTGFGSPKAFSKYFKEEFGILPSAYLNKAP